MRIKLEDSNKVFKWKRTNNILFIGYLMKNNEILSNEEIEKYFQDLNTIEEYEKKLKKIDGRYTIIINKKDEVVIISDIMRSFPIFYEINNGKLILSDNIQYFERKVLKENSVREMLLTGYVTGNNTLYNNVYQNESSKIIIIDKHNLKLKEKTYFYFKSVPTINKEKKEIFKELDKKYNESVQRLIRYAQGRKIVLPLSGGHDSRIIAYYLKKNNYENVITYTYGRKNNPEAIVSKKVAEYLNYKWFFVEYKNKSMQKKFYNDNLYSEVAQYCGSAYSVPLIQEWEAISNLKENEVLVGNEIIVPGYSGDFIAGSHIPKSIFEKENVSLEDLKYEISQRHYNLCPLYNKEYYLIFWNNIKKEYNLSYDRDYTKEKLYEILEMFDFKERQSKFISNAIRIYEFYGFDWYMPLWDKELVEYWKQIDYKNRYKRSLYMEFVQYLYPDLMAYAPISQDEILRYENRIYKIFKYYFNHFLNYYGYLKFNEYIKYCLKYRCSSYYFMFSKHYIKKLKQINNKKGSSKK